MIIIPKTVREIPLAEPKHHPLLMKDGRKFVLILISLPSGAAKRIPRTNRKLSETSSGRQSRPIDGKYAVHLAVKRIEMDFSVLEAQLGPLAIARCA